MDNRRMHDDYRHDWNKNFFMPVPSAVGDNAAGSCEECDGADCKKGYFHIRFVSLGKLYESRAGVAMGCNPTFKIRAAGVENYS
jgi:hypothetical protein